LVLPYNRTMKNATVNRASELNEFEIIQVADWMEQRYPNQLYTMTPGNDCIWVYWGSTVPMNLYFIFRDGKIVDVQVD
jgi:hypothetical protein